MATFFCSTPRCSRQWKNFRGRDVPRGPKCRDCGQRTTRLAKLPPGARASIRPEFFEYYDESLGQPIRSREHKKRVQRSLGACDWEPVNNSPGSQLSERLQRRGT